MLFLVGLEFLGIFSFNKHTLIKIFTAVLFSISISIFVLLITEAAGLEPIISIFIIIGIILALMPVRILRLGEYDIGGEITLKYGLKVVLGAILIALMLVTVAIMEKPSGVEPMTELYLLNEDGMASDYPYTVTISEPIDLILGLANHEGRDVDYVVQVWTFDVWLVNGIYNIRYMFYIDQYEYSLPSIEYDPDKWEPQLENNVSIELPYVGKYALTFILFKSEVPYYLSTVNSSVNYAGTDIDQLFYSIIDNTYQSVDIQLKVNNVI
jgi:uncharacterized membrane protein